MLAFAACEALALDVDSLPVWNPDSLVRRVEPAPVADSSDGGASLTTHGYKTMQVTVGDGDTQVDQQLRLSVNGVVGDSVVIDALLSDVDRKAGDQTTATLQEVDQVYFRVSSRHWLLHLGDLTWKDDCLGLFGLERTTLGGMAGFRTNYSDVRAAVGTDEANRIVRSFAGVSGQREGYAMSGNGNYVSVVPQSESVWLNGQKLERGKDYEVNYAGGLLNFKGVLMPSNEDEIRVEYDSYEDDNIFNLYAASGRFRHPNLYLDVSGFRLENDRHRLKRSVWTDEDYELLKNDRGDEFDRDDSLGVLNRPRRYERAGARLRLQAEHRYYMDLELAVSRSDSNTVSDYVDGSEGKAYRWFLTTDSSRAMASFPVALSAYGNYVQEGFNLSEFQGGDNDWDAYRLRDEWDLDSALLSSGSFRHDEFGLRMRLPFGSVGNVVWGYRQGDSERWNSSRVKASVEYRKPQGAGEIALVHVNSQTELERERYQGYFNLKKLQGFAQPFLQADFRFTQRDSSGLEDEFLMGKSGLGVLLTDDGWNLREAVEASVLDNRGDSYRSDLDDSGDDGWVDSLRVVKWSQSADVHLRGVELTHFLQFEHRDVAASGDEYSWAGDLAAKFGNEKTGIHGSASYKLGLTEEQTYTAIYKAVAKGTGDVRYDSLTGTFIEGVDNGDFVYEGMGRNDSVGAVLASSAGFSASIEMSPAKVFGVKDGFLRDVKLGGSFSATGEDTTGTKLYFPPAIPSALDDVSSGSIVWGGNVEWLHPSGVSLVYKPSASYDKKLSSIEYRESTFRHELDGGYRINESHFVGLNGLVENVDLEALLDLQWDTRSIGGRYRWNFAEGFSVEPGGKFRYGEGSEDTGREFDAWLWEASLKFGYTRQKWFDGFARFSAVQVDAGSDEIPYQMMSGYSDGWTFRLEASASLTVNQNISFGLHYVLRFGDAEENLFQKFSSEARAYF